MAAARVRLGSGALRCKVPNVDNGDIFPEIATSKPHSARMYDYFLGGKDNFAADRETANKALEAWPAMRMAARENRAFLGRVVRYLAAGAGVTQFLDIGSGLPGVGNVHEVAQQANPAARLPGPHAGASGCRGGVRVASQAGRDPAAPC